MVTMQEYTRRCQVYVHLLEQHVVTMRQAFERMPCVEEFAKEFSSAYEAHRKAKRALLDILGKPGNIGTFQGVSWSMLEDKLDDFRRSLGLGDGRDDCVQEQDEDEEIVSIAAENAYY